MKITRRKLRRIIKEAFWSTKEIKSIDDVQTVGDLRKLIASAQDAKRWEQTKGEAGDAVKGAIVDEILGKIPGAAAAKSMFDFVKSSYELPDEARTGTALDALDVDDHIAAIVDDPVENDFLAVFAEDLKKQDGDTPISDIDMTTMLSKHLKGKFSGRTVAGFQEGKEMKITKRQLRRIIREAIDPREMEEPLGGWAGNALHNDPRYKHHTDTDHFKEGDLVRKVDYRGDGRGGDYKKTVGDQIGTVIEIDEDIDGTQYTVIFPDGTTVMDTADSFETIKEALQFPDDVLVDSDSQDYQQGYADAYDGLKMQKNQSQQYQNGWDDGHFDIIRDNEPYGGASA